MDCKENTEIGQR